MTGVDQGGGVYEIAADFCLPGNCAAGTATANLEWKFVYNCATYEPLASNRKHVLDLANGAQDVLEVWWNDEDPTQFTAHAIDVLLYVDLNVSATRPATSWRSTAPCAAELHRPFDQPAGRRRHRPATPWPATASTRSRRHLPGRLAQGRDLQVPAQRRLRVLRAGRPQRLPERRALRHRRRRPRPADLPVVHYDRCTTIWRPVDGRLPRRRERRADPVGPSDVVSVNGTPSNVAPPSFSWNVPSLNDLLDDGVVARRVGRRRRLRGVGRVRRLEPDLHRVQVPGERRLRVHGPGQPLVHRRRRQLQPRQPPGPAAGRPAPLRDDGGARPGAVAAGARAEPSEPLQPADRDRLHGPPGRPGLAAGLRPEGRARALPARGPPGERRPTR